LAKTNKKQERTPNSRVEATDHAIGTIDREGADLTEGRSIRGVNTVAMVRLDGRIRPAISGEPVTIAVPDAGWMIWITFLELDRGRGSSDTDGCDGEECCEDLSGEQHLCRRAESGKRADSKERVGLLRDSSVQPLALLYASDLLSANVAVTLVFSAYLTVLSVRPLFADGCVRLRTETSRGWTEARFFLFCFYSAFLCR
jgi:hypothetical protein